MCRFVYERVRQTLLLVRAIRRFQKANCCTTWPVVLAGGKSLCPLLLFLLQEYYVQIIEMRANFKLHLISRSQYSTIGSNIPVARLPTLPSSATISRRNLPIPSRSRLALQNPSHTSRNPFLRFRTCQYYRYWDYNPRYN